jgi:hypothetical protein
MEILKKLPKRKSAPNWIFYLHANSFIFGPFLAILIKLLKSKTDLEFPKFSFKTHFGYEEVPMENVIHLFKSFMTIFI